MAKGTRGTRSVACLAGVVVALAACTADQGAESADGGFSAGGLASAELSESALVVGAYASPLEPFHAPDRVRAQAIADATNALISECMAERGFTHEGRGPRDEGSRWYGVADVDEASIYGYRRPEDVAQADSQVERPDGPIEAPKPIPVSAEVAALMGDEANWVEVKGDGGRVVGHYDPEGCYWIGTLTVQPEYFRSLELGHLLDALSNRASSAYRQDPEFQAAFDLWNGCIVAAGGEPAERGEEAIRGSFLDGPLSEAEITAATIDATCKHESGFLREWSRLRAEAEQALLDQNPNLMLEYLEIQQENYDRAQ